MDRVAEEPWRYPALLDTRTCREFYHEFSSIASTFDVPASTGSDFVSSNAITLALGRMFKKVGGVIGYSVQYAQSMAGKGKDYYAFYAKRMSDELALRGIPPSLLK